MLAVKRRGSITIEAALIMPLIIFSIVFLFYAGFYLHDLCVCKGEAAVIAQKICAGSLRSVDGQTKQVDYSREYRDILGDSWKSSMGSLIDRERKADFAALQEQMLLSSIQHVNIEYAYSSLTHKLSCEVIVEGRLSFPFKLPGISSGWYFTAKSNQMLIDAVKSIWLSDSLKSGEK